MNELLAAESGFTTLKLFAMRQLRRHISSEFTIRTLAVIHRIQS